MNRFAQRMDDILKVLRSANQETPISQVESNLSSALEQLSLKAASTSQHAALLQIVADRIAPYLSNRATNISSACATIDALFLNGIDHVAFRVLVQALRNNNNNNAGCGNLILARTATLFVSQRTGGTRRIASAISHAAHSGDNPGKLAADLVHLPTRISNAALEAQNSYSVQNVSLLDPAVHAQTITKAILRQPEALDPARDALVGALLGALARLGFADRVISSFATEDNVNVQRVTRILLLASEEYISVYLRATLELPANKHAFAGKLSREILRTSATARATCVSMRPYNNNILKTYLRVSIPRLVAGLYDVLSEDEYIDAMERTARTWGAQKFAMNAHVGMQRQFTRLLLVHFRMAQLKNISHHKLDRFAVVTAQGVSFRLDHGDEKIRRFGMVVGEAFSKLSGDENVLKFPRNAKKQRQEDGNADGDSDFSDIANDDDFDCFGFDKNDDVDSAFSNSDVDKVFDIERDDVEDPEAKPERNFRPHRRPRPARWEFDTDEPPSREPEAWELEDDWSSLESGSISSYNSDEDSLACGNNGTLEATRADYEAIRKQIDAPLSVPRILGLLRSANSGQDDSLKYTPDIICSTLKSISSRVAARTLPKAGGGTVELARCVFLIDVRKYPDDEFDKLNECRNNTMELLIQFDLENIAGMFIREFVCTDMSDLARRNEALRFVVEGAKNVAERKTIHQEEKEVMDVGNGNSNSNMKQVGTVIRRSSRSLSLAKSSKKHVHVNEYTVCAGTLFFQLANGLKTEAIMKEAKFFSNGISSLAALLSLTSDACESRREIGIALMEMCGRSFRHDNPSVRRACALFAAISLSKWTEKLQLIADGKSS